jgi:hypothetical protein
VERTGDLFAQNSAEGEFISSDEIALDLKNAFPAFKAQVNSGKTTIVLNRTVGEDLNVQVVVDLCSPDYLPGGGEENDEERPPEEEDATVMALRGRMTAGKAGSSRAISFIFHVPTAADAGVELLSVIAHKPVDPSSPDALSVSGGHLEDEYAPPVFEDLDFSLQASFVKFMADCGLDIEFAEGVRAVADRKEQFEYLQWLSRCHEAVKGTARA